jgi:hypothetical protein
MPVQKHKEMRTGFAIYKMSYGAIRGLSVKFVDNLDKNFEIVL